MIALDTSLIVRLLTWDDPRAAEAAAIVIRDHEVAAPITVLAETHWVLRARYGFDRERANRAIAELCAIPTLAIPERDRVLSALRWCEDGLEFADALHVSLSDESSAYATFDQSLVKKSKRAATKPRALLPSQLETIAT